MISHQATAELRKILEQEITKEYVEKLSDEDIRNFGELILWTMAANLKQKVKLQ